MLASIPTTYNPRREERAYQPFGAALALLKDRRAEVVLEGPAGTGKSRAILEKLHLCALKYAGMRGLIVRKTRESISESVLVTFEEKVLPEQSSLTNGANRHTRQVYRYPNGSEIVVAGMLANGKDQRAKVMSTEYDVIAVFEATELSEHEYEQLTTRLRNNVMPYQQLIADCNPDAPTHWLHQRCDKQLAAVHFSRHEDNPALFDHRRNEWTAFGQQYIERLDRLSGVRKQRLRYGQRAASEGMVYEFDRSIHLIDQLPAGHDHWRIIRVIDFGFMNPFVCHWWKIDGDDRMYLYREIYHSQRTVARHCVDIHRHSGGETIEATVSDHDAEDRATLLENGIDTIAADKAVSLGVQEVQERMQRAGDGRPRLFVVRGALVEVDPLLEEAKKPICTEQEFDGYVWPRSTDGRPVKEAPVKENDHGMDACRYAAMYLHSGGALVW